MIQKKKRESGHHHHGAFFLYSSSSQQTTACENERQTFSVDLNRSAGGSTRKGKKKEKVFENLHSIYIKLN